MMEECFVDLNYATVLDWMIYEESKTNKLKQLANVSSVIIPQDICTIYM